MTERQQHALLDLRRRRRELAIESGIVVLGAFGLLALAGGVPGEGAARWTFFGALVLFAVASGGWMRRMLQALAAPCPRCGSAFFTSWERLLISLPWLHGSCAHCGQGLAPERRRG